MSNIDNAAVSTHLGKQSRYESTYNPSLLVRELRENNRKHLNINSDNLPFVGYDLWNAYEVSALNKHGVPLTAVAKIIYSASSQYIVESKSLKLYLNSLNMTQYDSDLAQVIYGSIEVTIENDLTTLLGTPVTVTLFDAGLKQNTSQLSISDSQEFHTLEQMHSLRSIVCTQYSESPDILQGNKHGSSITTQKYHSTLLKSNCRVTGQPDWGDVYITYRGNYTIDTGSLLKYIVSFRDECHFHEEICETIYKRLYDKFSPEELTVVCLYVRRGGIDINPIRSSKTGNIYSTFTDSNLRFTKSPRQ